MPAPVPTPKRSTVESNVIREIPVMETTGFMAATFNSKLNNLSQDLRRTCLVVGIPNENATPAMMRAVREKLAALGRTDVLVIAVDREQMREKMSILGMRFGVILDVDSIDAIDGALEPFMAELDLQGLYADYPELGKLAQGAVSGIDKDILVRIIRDKRFLPAIRSLDLEFMFSHGKAVQENHKPIKTGHRLSDLSPAVAEKKRWIKCKPQADPYKN